MSSDIPFKFGLSPDEPLLFEQSDLWSASLPMTRQAFNGASGKRACETVVTYGDYFFAARDFLTQEDFKWLRHAAGRLIAQSVTVADIDHVCVYLLKHGAFYHPAYVILSVFGRRLALVLNVAVSNEGREVLPREVDCLNRLNEEFSIAFWPAVFGRGQGRSSGGQALPMFLGPWFSGCYEFHLTRQATGKAPAVVVWDTDHGHRILSGQPVMDLIRRAASILTYAYNPLTFEAILDWHHAAGDFVVQTSAEGLDLRLITVRNYAPLVRNPEPDIEAVLDGLLLFLVNLSFKLRLDRLDGIGDLALYPESVIPAIYDGFRLGLKQSVGFRGLPDDLIPAVDSYFGLHPAEQLVSVAAAVMANYPPASNEGRLLRASCGDHLGLLARSFASPQKS